jgi:glutathione synthase
MKIGIVVDDINDELPGYTSTHLAMAALRRNHEIWYIELGAFSYDTDQMVHANAVQPSRRNYEKGDHFLADLQSYQAKKQRITIDTLDVLILRNDPSKYVFEKPWARLAAMNFGRLAMRHGVIVLNDPDGLSRASNKMYLEYLPSFVRPASIITREISELKEFIRAQPNGAVIKPLLGSGGHNVFLLTSDNMVNLNQMIDAVLRDGYAIAQEYLPASEEGDIRLFLMNGEVFSVDGKPCMVRRTRPAGDFRNNLTVGGTRSLSELTPEIKSLAEVAKPYLIADGLFLVGADIVGNKFLEINVYSPGGMVGASRLLQVDFPAHVIAAIESKLALFKNDPKAHTNREIATLAGISG